MQAVVDKVMIESRKSGYISFNNQNNFFEPIVMLVSIAINRIAKIGTP